MAAVRERMVCDKRTLPTSRIGLALQMGRSVRKAHRLEDRRHHGLGLLGAGVHAVQARERGALWRAAQRTLLHDRSRPRRLHAAQQCHWNHQCHVCHQGVPHEHSRLLLRVWQSTVSQHLRVSNGGRCFVLGTFGGRVAQACLSPAGLSV
jgi:enoyl-CoA hydratase/carnithine racemase